MISGVSQTAGHSKKYPNIQIYHDKSKDRVLTVIWPCGLTLSPEVALCSLTMPLDL